MDSFGSWSVLTTNFLIVLYLALNGVTLAAILHLANAKWRTHVRFLAVSSAALLPVAFVMLCILLFFGENTFQWLAHSGHGGEGEHHMPGWHNYTFLVTREILAFLAIAGLYTLFIKYQHAASVDPRYAAQRRFRNVALLIPVAYVLYATMVAWDFEMTMVPNWHSASYGAYHFISHFQFYLAFFAVFLFILTRSGKLKVEVPKKIFNYFAQMMLGFTILWTYLYFTQYLIYWYGRLPEEIVRFRNMLELDLSTVWWTFLVLKFIIPFVTFATWTPNRHNPKVIVGVASCILLGTWLERYTWISGSVDPSHYHLPMTGGFDIITTIVTLAVIAFTLRWSLLRNGLIKQS
ncbi:MAG: hypothetical protein OEX00_00400 [Gammaproteobacteria bacterium]|nr:hypothetical protein [Gammaproteobacteria bacterium]MDH5691938.1 hypothetical protein [Gammaproteobacteria bacterium]